MKSDEAGAGAGDGVRPVSRSAMDDFEQEEISARQNLTRQRGEAIERKGRQTAWLMLFGLGPAALVAIGLAFLLGQPDLLVPFAALGAGVQLFRIWRESRKIKELEKELADPIDGS